MYFPYFKFNLQSVFEDIEKMKKKLDMLEFSFLVFQLRLKFIKKHARKK